MKKIALCGLVLIALFLISCGNGARSDTSVQTGEANIKEGIIECTSSSACPSGQICDLSTTGYGKCIKQEGAPYCGDGKCSIDESTISCPKDCKNG